ncbi:MAG: PEP-CTERM sorting domain-containing protein [Thermoguttaceae bacterium]
MRRLSALIAIVAFAGLVATAQADIIYQDTFGTAGTLNGSTPTVRTGDYGSSSTAVWIANTKFSKTSGSCYNSVVSTTGYGAWLPLTVSAGNIYTVSVDIQMYTAASGIGNGTEWAEVGFAYNSTTPSRSSGYAFDDYGRAWAIQKSGSTTSSFMQLGRGYTNMGVTDSRLELIDYSSAQFGSEFVFHNLKVVLDTSGAVWTMACYLDNAATPYNTYTYSTNPGVNYVGFAVSGKGSYVDNFTVSAVAVPEPSTLAILAAGLVGLIAYAWRKR